MEDKLELGRAHRKYNANNKHNTFSSFQITLRTRIMSTWRNLLLSTTQMSTRMYLAIRILISIIIIGPIWKKAAIIYQTSWLNVCTAHAETR